MSVENNVRLRFGDFEFDAQSHTLFRDGWPVKIQPQPLRILAALLERPGEIVSREQLQAQIWGDSTFVEFDQGLNYSIRQIRLALRDRAASPTYIETLPKQGYRFLAKVQTEESIAPPLNLPEDKAAAEVTVIEQPKPLPDPASRGWRRIWLIAATACLALAAVGLAYLTRVRRAPSSPARYTQLTDLTDSAIAPVLSPDGRMVAFFRGNRSFFTGDQIYVKVLPNGAAKRLTDDKRYKYSLAFSPDGSQIAYTAVDSDKFSTYTVSVLGGESHLLLSNAAGLTWLDGNQLLFSQFKSGLHLGVVTGTVTRDHFREIYFPPFERAMAHYSFASPDRRTALVVEMNERGAWTPCRLISLSGTFQPKPVGPDGFCTSAAWSPDGTWMYFVAVVNGESHLWRARFPDGRPEQLTFGPTEEDGVAPEQDGRSVITAMGFHTSTLWMHDEKGERALLSEGEVEPYWLSPPSFSADGKTLYYLLRHRSGESEPELWRTDLASGVSEAVFPGLCMRSYAVSADNRQVLYTTAIGDGKPRLWIAPVDKSSPPKPIGHLNDRSPYFGPRDEVLFEFTEGTSNYIGRMDQDGSNRSKLIPDPIYRSYGVSSGRRWIVANLQPPAGEPLRGPVAIPTAGGQPRNICASECLPIWSLDGKFLFVPVQAPSSTNPGRSLAIPLGPGEDLSALPPEGIKPMAQASDVPGSLSIDRADFVPGKNLSDFAYVKTTMHYNLFRVQVP